MYELDISREREYVCVRVSVSNRYTFRRLLRGPISFILLFDIGRRAEKKRKVRERRESSASS